MSVWANIATAEVFERGSYFQPGAYDVRVVRCLLKDTRKSGLGFIVELEILNSNNPSHQIGSKATFFQGMKNQMTAMSSVKEFMIALWGLDPRDPRVKTELEPVLAQIMDQATGPENVLQGRCLHLDTHMIKTKERQMDFTVHKWAPYTGPTPAAMTAAMMAEPVQQQAHAPQAPMPQMPPRMPGFAPGQPTSGFVPQPPGTPPGFAPNQFMPAQQAYVPPQAPQPQYAPPPQAPPPFMPQPAYGTPQAAGQAYAMQPQASVPQAGPPQAGPGSPPPMVFDPVTGWRFA